MKISLHDIDFGKDTAEFDKDLARYFVTTNTYTRILSGKKGIIAGRKGAGKTALMRYLVADADQSRAVIALEASQATLLKIKQSIDKLGDDLSDLDASFKHAWLFSIGLALADRVMEAKFALTEDAQRVYAFAREHLAYSAPDRVSIVANYIIGWFVNAKGISIGDFKVERDLPAQAVHIFDERTLVSLITSCARELNRRGKDVYLCFDKLDERWEASKGNVALVQGLLLAVRELRALNLQLHPVVLIRDDILRTCTDTFQHIDHFRMDIEMITWTDAGLVELLARRAQYALERKEYPLLPNAKPGDIWNLVFEATVPFKKSPIPMTAWMVERTLARPRDLVLFANMALEHAVSSGASNAPISKDHVKAVERKFSEQKYDDLIAELSVEWPDSRKIFETFRLRPAGFSSEELNDLLQEVMTRPGLAPEWVPDDLLEFKRWLYRVGFLSFTKVGGALRGTRIVHSGVEREPDEFMAARKVFVSPIFRAALQMRDRKAGGGGQTEDDDDE